MNEQLENQLTNENDVTRGRNILSQQKRFILYGIALFIIIILFFYLAIHQNNKPTHQNLNDYTAHPGRVFKAPLPPPNIPRKLPQKSTSTTSATNNLPLSNDTPVINPMGFGSISDTNTPVISHPTNTSNTNNSSFNKENSEKDTNKYDPQKNGTKAQNKAHVGEAIIGKPFNMHLLLRRNTMFHCVVEQPINTAVPGPISCITADDIMSADGSVILIEKGAEVSGEVMNSPVDGENLVFIGFDEVITQDGLPIYFDGSAGDTLGMSGVPGKVNEHFWRKIKAALLLTTIEVGGQIAENQTQKSGTTNVSLNGSYGNQLGQQALQNDLNIRPSLYDPQANVITITVRQDIPFDKIYQLRARG